MTQLTLQDITVNKHGGNPNSIQANLKVAPYKSGMEQKVFELIQSSNGMTLKEIAFVLGKLPHQISGRISKLKADSKIECNGLTRKGCAVLVVKL